MPDFKTSPEYKEQPVRPVPMGPFLFRAGAPAVLLLCLAGCGAAKTAGKGYELVRIGRGAIERTVSSSGTLNPVATVKVLPRMSGKVEKLYVDYNDPVRKGMILAELNTDMLRLQREQQMAQVIKGRATCELQRINFMNQEALAEKDLISEYELRSAQTTLDIQAAELAAAEASLKAIETEINQYAFITSPIDGIVLERNINEGDTVVDSSSSNSSSIFTLAENLQEMQIESWVGELDIAAIHPGQEVRFTLESLPDRAFTGAVESRRLMPAVQDNVVSYKVIIDVENRDGALLPGMTCSVEFIERRIEDALLVPNGALRYRPTGLSAEETDRRIFNAGLGGMHGAERAAALAAEERRLNEARSAGEGGNAGRPGGLAGLVAPMPGRLRRSGGDPGAGAGTGGRAAGRKSPRTASLWYLDGSGKPDCIMVRAGLSDGSFTEILPMEGAAEGELEGREIILRERL
ncbi:MAG: efflux RND transporter periplasmic adaptor subunit [Treponema sp.]|jgi:HlyD family secretion protein|nr:efflux RND transporter periplasmic adaptor subunit [Treponema sp.]